jgi:hypothetical protein
VKKENAQLTIIIIKQAAGREAGEKQTKIQGGIEPWQ